jgi:NAD(P)-dependent dehydrogenase (short-subunit alcohol dehydrogenase family)
MSSIKSHPNSYPKAALVTGGGKRLGRAMALALAEEGYAVAIHYNRSAAEAQSVARIIHDKGGRAITLRADLMEEAAVEELLPEAKAKLGPIGLLVNNASTFEWDTALSADRESWDKALEPNLRAPFVLSQAFARQLPEEEGGLIVNLLDERVWNLTPYFTSYTVAKAGLWTLTQTLALAFAPRIRVNGIGPGPALPSPRQTQEEFDRMAASMPLGRGTSPEEICTALKFLLAVPSITGQMIALDGGQHLGWSLPPDRKTPKE